MELKGSPRHSPLRALNLLSRAIVLFYFRSFHAQPLNASRPQKGCRAPAAASSPSSPQKRGRDFRQAIIRFMKMKMKFTHIKRIYRYHRTVIILRIKYYGLIVAQKSQSKVSCFAKQKMKRLTKNSLAFSFIESIPTEIAFLLGLFDHSLLAARNASAL